MKKAVFFSLIIASLLFSIPMAAAEGQGESASGAPYEIVWYFIGNGPQKDVAQVEAAVNKYVQGKGLNATVKLVCFDWGSYTQKMQTIIAAGEKYDICFTSVWANFYRPQAAKGAFLPLNDLLTKYAPKTKAALGKDFLEGAAIDGINYAIPANKEKAHNWGVIVRKDLVQKYKLDVSKIKKLEDLEPLFKVIKKNEPTVYPFCTIVGEDAYRILDWDKVVGDNIPVSLPSDNSTTRIMNELEAPQTMAHFKLMHKWYQAGYIRKDAAVITDFMAELKSGNTFSILQSLKPGKDAEMENSTGYPWIQIDLTQPVMSNRETTGSMQAISVTCQKPEMVMSFLEAFNTDKYLNNLINFGIEGTHYVKVSENVIKKGPNNDNYNPGTAWMFGNQFINYLWDNEDPKKWDKFLAYNKAALPLKDLGFAMNTESVKTEVAACLNVWTEYLPQLETGTADPVKLLPEAIAKFKAVGVDKIIAEAQKQYDAWLKKTGK
ncbi:MAG: ABC transporter substrate-binding protein [Spirochaetales bacterium]|nr:ABC transporter substrate-binding protein [Spirochaetales bacterium]